MEKTCFPKSLALSSAALGSGSTCISLHSSACSLAAGLALHRFSLSHMHVPEVGIQLWCRLRAPLPFITQHLPCKQPLRGAPRALQQQGFPCCRLCRCCLLITVPLA